MKKSQIFLSLALTVPALIYVIGITAGLNKVTVSQNPVQKPVAQANAPDANAQGPFSHDSEAPVGDALTITANGINLDLEFDPSLTQVAKFTVMSAAADDVTTRINSDGIE